MIISKYASTKWNSKTKKYYESLGYSYTKMGDVFEVLVEHLPLYSNTSLTFKCDYCGNEYTNTLANRTKVFNQNDTLKNDVCKKQSCIQSKIKESNLIKYGVEYAISSDLVRDKITLVFKEKYNVTNPFQIQSVKEKIKNTNLQKYGNVSFTRTEEYKKKSEATSLKKYGFKNHMQSPEGRAKLKGVTLGEKHPNWKGGVSKKNTLLRQTTDYRNWRKSIFDKNNYTCQRCKVRGGKLNAHHIVNFSDNEKLRYSIENGITLCEPCHMKFHSLYGKRNNTHEQLTEFLYNHG